MRIEHYPPLLDLPFRHAGCTDWLIPSIQGYGTRRQDQASAAESKGLDTQDETWGRMWTRVAGTGLNEEEREHQASIRKYLAYYVQLLTRTNDFHHLQAAAQYLNAPNFAAQHPGMKDIARYSDTSR